MNILITGASRGIGFEICKSFAEIGNHNIIAISRNENGLKALKNECIKKNIEAHLYPFAIDLNTLEENESKLNEFISEKFDKIDILINNAGFLINKPFENLNSKDIQNSFQVNVISNIQLIQTCLPYLKKSEIGHTVNISSMGGYQGSAKFPGLTVYSASKAAIASLTECLAEEYKNTNLKFNCLALGAVQTEMLNEAFPGYKAPVQPEEMARYIVNFALNDHKYMNGKIIPLALNTP